jgi:hypothetical protein
MVRALSRCRRLRFFVSRPVLHFARQVHPLPSADALDGDASARTSTDYIIRTIDE